MLTIIADLLFQNKSLILIDSISKYFCDLFYIGYYKFSQKLLATKLFCFDSNNYKDLD